MSRNSYAKKSKININELPYISYVNEDKRSDLCTQRRINSFTPTMIDYVNEKINSAYVEGVGIQCKDLATVLFGNKPERGAYEGLALAAFGLVATRSTKSNRVFYVRISDVGNTDFAPDSSVWHNITEESVSSVDTITTVEDMISSTVEKINKKYATGNASARNKLIRNSIRLSNTFHKLGKIFSEIVDNLKTVKV